TLETCPTVVVTREQPVLNQGGSGRSLRGPPSTVGRARSAAHPAGALPDCAARKPRSGSDNSPLNRSRQGDASVGNHSLLQDRLPEQPAASMPGRPSRAGAPLGTYQAAQRLRRCHTRSSFRERVQSGVKRPRCGPPLQNLSLSLATIISRAFPGGRHIV